MWADLVGHLSGEVPEQYFEDPTVTEAHQKIPKNQFEDEEDQY
jgi:hypothetical protein